MGDAFCLKWNNHQTTLVSVFDKLFECESLVDCTLAAEGRQLKAHKVVLSACSPYLEELIRNHEDRHPIIIFNNIRYEELKAMLEYMYRGEVNVSQEQLDSFLKVAESLKIKGLTDQGGGNKNNDKEEQRTGKKRRRRASSESTQSEDKEPLKPEPKLEPIDEANSEPIEDLTIEEEDDEYGPPGPGTSQGSFSSQDFNNWQVSGDITSDEVFLAAQQEINSQGNPTPALMKVKMVFYSSGLDEEMAGQHYCLRWNNYQSNMTSVFHHLLRTQAFVDVTLACNDQSLKAHKVVLSACSSYFQKLLLENPCKHPTIIMPQDVCFTDLKFIIEFVYKGEIDVSQAQLQSVLKTADQLKIKGLCEVPEGKEGAEVTPLPHRKTLSIRQRRLARRRLQYRQRLARQKASILQSEDTTLSAKRILYGAVLPQTPNGTHSDVGTSTDDQDTKDIIDTALVVASPPPELTQKVTPQVVVTEHGNELNESTAPVTLVSPVDIPQGTTHRDIAVDASDLAAGVEVDEDENVKVKFETLRAIDQTEQMDMEHMPDRGVQAVGEDGMHTMMITPELLGLIPSSQSDGSDAGSITKGSTNNTISSGGKSWRQEDMEAALEALRSGSMSLSRASAIYSIPSTTLWQRAHRQGIETPKKDGPLKTWTEDNLNVALDALRTGSISANKASKAYGIPSSTLYKIARREGIRLAAPFNAAPTSWAPEDLERALESIRSGQSTVQRAAAEYGIPSGTLYGRCKREGIELSRANPTPWSEAAMNQALDAVRIGQMSINQAAIHFNLPYSSLYGRFKRGKYDGSGGIEETNGPIEATGAEATPPAADLLPTAQSQPQIMLVQYQQPIHMYQPT